MMDHAQMKIIILECIEMNVVKTNLIENAFISLMVEMQVLFIIIQEIYMNVDSMMNYN